MTDQDEQQEQPKFEPFHLVTEFEEDDRVFSTEEELLKWVKAEFEAWSWANELGQHITDGVAKLIQRLRDIESRVEQMNGADDVAKRNLRTSIEEELAHWKPQQRFTSTSEFGRFVMRIATTDKVVAAATAHYFMRGANGLKGTYMGIAATMTTLFKMGLLNAESIVLTPAPPKSTQNWTKFQKRAIVNWKTHEERMKAQFELALAERDKAESDFREAIDRSQKELAEFEKLCLEGIALRAPVKYWKARARMHRREAFNNRKLLIQWSIIAVAIILCFAMFYIIPSLDGSGEFWPIALLLAVVGFVAWPLRIINKIWMSNLHLSMDCQERATIVQTYLSLLESDSVTSAQRDLVLPALFRSGATGLATDDGSPSVHVDAINKFIKPG